MRVMAFSLVRDAKLKFLTLPETNRGDKLQMLHLHILLHARCVRLRASAQKLHKKFSLFLDNTSVDPSPLSKPIKVIFYLCSKCLD